jgi:hypothetical protein
MPRSGSAHVVAKTTLEDHLMITFSDFLLKGARDTWRCKIFAALFLKQNHRPVQSCVLRLLS